MLMRYRPYTSSTMFVDRLTDRLETLVDASRWRYPFWGNFGLVRTPLHSVVSVSEDDNTWSLEADLPGMEPKELEVSIDGSAIHIRGERRSEKRESERDFILRSATYRAID